MYVRISYIVLCMYIISVDAVSVRRCAGENASRIIPGHNSLKSINTHTQ